MHPNDFPISGPMGTTESEPLEQNHNKNATHLHIIKQIIFKEGLGLAGIWASSQMRGCSCSDANYRKNWFSLFTDEHTALQCRSWSLRQVLRESCLIRAWGITSTLFWTGVAEKEAGIHVSCVRKISMIHGINPLVMMSRQHYFWRDYYCYVHNEQWALSCDTFSRS